MPWFPDFVSAVELARRETRAADQADPVGQYFTALNRGDTHVLETVWPGEVVVYDPRAGEVRGHEQLQRFVRQNQAWLAERHARIETVAATCVGRRAVVELLAHLADGGRELAWPVAVVAESPDDRSVVFRTYCSQWPVDGRRHLRPPILEPGAARPGDVVGRHQAALEAGDTEAIVHTFAPGGYFREPIGPHSTHSGVRELRSFFTRSFSAGRRRPAALRRDRRWRALRRGIQLCPLGQPRPAAPGGNRRLRTRPGRAAGRRPRLRRRRATCRALLTQAGVAFAGSRVRVGEPGKEYRIFGVSCWCAPGRWDAG
jgi:ketosteroid isomerase-like protein